MGLEESKTKYFTKVTVFNGQRMTLYSLDGNTWSTRKLELAQVKERQELKRAELAGKKDELEVGAGPDAKPLKLVDDELDVGFDADYDVEPAVIVKGEEEEEGLPFFIPEDEEEEKKTKKPKAAAAIRSKAAAKLPIKPASAAFDKNKKKSKVKVSSKKQKEIRKQKPLKAKKSSKVTSIKSAGKKSKGAAPKRRKAA